MSKNKNEKNLNQEEIISEQVERFKLDLREVREKKLISTYDLAKLTGIIQQNITRLEVSDSNPNLKTLVRIANALDVVLLPVTPEERKLIEKLRSEVDNNK